MELKLLEAGAGRRIAFISGKGGVGKTTCCVNVGFALSMFGKRTCLVDGNFTLGDIAYHLGVTDAMYTIDDGLKNRKKIREIAYPITDNLRVCLAPIKLNSFSYKHFRKFLKNRFFNEYITLIDSPPTLEKTTREILGAIKENILVVNPELASVADGLKSMMVAKSCGSKTIGIIVNRFIDGEKNQLSLKEIERAFSLPILGVIPEDKCVRKSIFMGEPVVFSYPLAPASIAFKKLAANLIGVDFRPPRFLWLRRLIRRGR